MSVPLATLSHRSLSLACFALTTSVGVRGVTGNHFDRNGYSVFAAVTAKNATRNRNRSQTVTETRPAAHRRNGNCLGSMRPGDSLERVTWPHGTQAVAVTAGPESLLQRNPSSCFRPGLCSCHTSLLRTISSCYFQSSRQLGGAS